VGANVVERNPQAKAELTLAELDQRFQGFIERYHQEIHSETGLSPLQFWQEHVAQRPVEERLLDVLLQEAAQRRVLKEGIKYGGRVYWHADLATIVGEDVLVRAAPSYTAPDELEVYFQMQWRCTAFALDSAKGRAVPRPVVAEAQRRQRAHARKLIAAAREKGAETPPSTTPPRSPRSRAEPAPPTPPALASGERSPDFFDFLLVQPTRKDAAHDS
jgi:hypothetical protein